MRPSEMLKDSCSLEWQAATNHVFCQELTLGSLSLDKMRIYLAQDYTFIDNFVRLAASAIHHAPTLADRLPLAAFLGIIAGPENTYFQRSFDSLNVSKEEQETPSLLAPTAGFQALMLKAAQSGSYANMVAVLTVAEWVYLSWTQNTDRIDSPLPFYFQEWINLHEGEYFESVVEHLRTQLDRAYDAADGAEKATIADYFKQAVTLEKQFFDACYDI
ncbi:TenA family protein [Marinomonas sp. C2222]|uniref:Aminopyrimidine aminohydrolase n=1 Tax=Marinomonas sargassi TaxID=2984494 RepID=A0ABT2YR72_9GAMM|nr:TenA family protein [Marinomonas sargassi]MCV2402398.1 TenA family protein [Marinomonas sargassi]